MLWVILAVAFVYFFIMPVLIQPRQRSTVLKKCSMACIEDGCQDYCAGRKNDADPL